MSERALPEASVVAPGRPRSSDADAAILAAARALFAEGGHGAVTMEAVARRAGVGKQTVYRRHADRDAVLVAAWLEDAVARVPIPDPSLPAEQALTAFLAATFRALRASGDAMRRLMAQAQFDAALRERVRDDFVAGRRAVLRELLSRLCPQADAQVIELAVDQAYGVLWYRLLVGHGPLDEALAADLARVLLAAPGMAGRADRGVRRRGAARA